MATTPISEGDLRQLVADLTSNAIRVAVTGQATGSTAASSGIATTDNGPTWTQSYLHTASADASGGVDLTAAPTSGQKIVVDDIIVSTDTAMWVLFEEETSGTDIIKLYLAANSGAQISPRKLKLATADKKLRLDTEKAGNIAVTVLYHSEA